MNIPREIIDEIRARTSLAEVIGKYVTLQRTGTSLKGLCPFHGERTPSFNVNETRNIWHCFGCGEGGDVFGFLMKQENRSFMEVVEDLGVRVGIEIPKAPLTPAQEQARSENEEMLFVNEKAKGFFRTTLAAPEGKSAREYFKKRGLGADVIDEFGLGYCGPGWDALVRFFQANRIDLRSGEKAGLFTRRRETPGKSAGSGTGVYDRFHERITFCVTNFRGRVIGFGGRSLDGPTTKGEGSPKYLNSSESPVYKKSDALYGLDTARAAIGKTNRVILVEGYFDLLGLAQAGIREVVATCGTALTPGHLAILRRYTTNVILLYDGDDAGRKAAERALPLFLEAGMSADYCGLPQGEDPDTWVAKVGRDEFLKLLAGSESVAEYFIQRLAKVCREKSAAERSAMLTRVSPVFRKVQDRVLRDDYAAKLGVALDLPLESVVGAIASMPLPAGGAPRPQEQKPSNDSQFRAQYRDGGRPDFRRAGGPVGRPGRWQQNVPSGPPSADLPIGQKLSTLSAGDRNSEETVLRLMLGSKRVADSVRADRIHLLFRDLRMRSLGEKLAEAVSRGSARDQDDGAGNTIDQPDVGAAIDSIPNLDDGERNLITRLSVDVIPNDSETSWKIFQDVIVKLKSRDLDQRNRMLNAEIAAAEKSKDTAKVEALLNQKRDLLARNKS